MAEPTTRHREGDPGGRSWSGSRWDRSAGLLLSDVPWLFYYLYVRRCLRESGFHGSDGAMPTDPVLGLRFGALRPALDLAGYVQRVVPNAQRPDLAVRDVEHIHRGKGHRASAHRAAVKVDLDHHAAP